LKVWFSACRLPCKPTTVGTGKEGLNYTTRGEEKLEKRRKEKNKAPLGETLYPNRRVRKTYSGEGTGNTNGPPREEEN